MQNGWIKLHRKFFKNPLWKENRELSKAEAWLYLLINARIEASTIVHMKRKDIDLKRGELIVSERELAHQWLWSRGRVRNFLAYLKRQKMIAKKSQSGFTVILILNYSLYQGKYSKKEKEETSGDFKKSKGSQKNTNTDTPMSASERFKMRHGI